MRTYLQNFFNTRFPGNVQRMLLKNFLYLTWIMLLHYIVTVDSIWTDTQ